MHIHILGISGTFMSALGLIAREMGYTVTGSDAHCYPPISDLLQNHGIQWVEGYDDTTLALRADCVIVGNAMKRGMPVVEAVLNAGKPYTSGPQWLAEHVLSRYKVMAVSGTHGKTTTTSMLAYILDKAGYQPGFLIGGVSSNFHTSARLGTGQWFVIEADEYDSAFFDKRPKLMHYRPQVAILNNLEFDHADIYPDLAAIQQQFHYFLRTIPSQGLVIKPRDDNALNDVLAKGQFSNVQQIALQGDADWRAELLDESGSSFRIMFQNQLWTEVNWSLIGHFNVENALAACAASAYAGVPADKVSAALAEFIPVKRRLEVVGTHQNVTVYDDFAHHPTAITRTLQALKQSQRHQRVRVVLEFASYTMRSGVHAHKMVDALCLADEVFVLNPKDFNLAETAHNWSFPYQLCDSVDDIVEKVVHSSHAGDAIIVMSNRGFEHIHQRLLTGIQHVGAMGVN